MSLDLEVAIKSLLNARTKEAKLQALHDLLHRFYVFPDSRITAVKGKVITALLRQKCVSEDKEVLSLVQEALCLMGYVDPPKGHGIKILSIDGGGVKGVLPLKAMMKLENLTGKPIYELFDYVCGVSTGAIQACSIFPQKQHSDEVLNYYKELSKQVFKSNVLIGTGRLIRSHGYYNSTKWEELLQTMVGKTKMIQTSSDISCPKISVVSTVVSKGNNRQYVFRNYEFWPTVRSRYFGSSEHLLWEAVRASSAAPGYFQEFQLGNYLHQDGGLLANNPCTIAIHEAQLLWPGEHLQCVVSLGTGLHKPDFSSRGISKTTWADKFSTLVECATDTEAIHHSLSEYLPKNIYYRFNPHLTEMIGMDEVRPDKINQLELDADMYYYQNEDRFRAAAQKLQEPRRTTQKIRDWLSFRADICGLRANL